MVKVQNIEGLAYRPFAQEQAKAPENKGFFESLPDAFAQENDVFAAIDLITRDAFPVDPLFNPAKAMEDSPLKNDYFDVLARATSQDDFNAISSRLNREQTQRQNLASAGWGGIGASIVAGLASPTMFIPLLGPARGLKGAGQAVALAGAAATAQESALYLAQETRTGEEVAYGIAAGTVLGGILGSAASFLPAKARVAIELDMATGKGTEAVYPSAGVSSREAVGELEVSPPRGELDIPLEVAPVIKASRADVLARAFEMSREEIARLKTLPETTSVDLIRAASRSLYEDAARIELETPKVQALDADGLPKAAGADVNAQTLRPRRNILQRDRVSGWLNTKMAQLNPVTRLIEQKTSPVASYWASQFHDAGLVLVEAGGKVATAVGGTIASRSLGHTAALGKFIQGFDDAYSRHVFGDKLPTDQMQGAFWATMRSGVNRMPEGKLTRNEFDDLVFRIANTGEDYADPNVNRAVGEMKKILDYYKKVAEEAYGKRVEIDGSSARRLFDPEGDLGPGVENYVHHIFNSENISKDPSGFMQTIRDNTIRNSEAAQSKMFGKWRKRQDSLEEDVRTLALTPAKRKKELAAVAKSTEALKTRQVMKDWNTNIAILESNSLQAKASGDPDLIADAKLELDEFRKAKPDAVKNIERELLSLKKQTQRLKQEPTKTAKTKAAKAVEQSLDDIAERTRIAGGTDFNVTKGTADFSEHGDEMAELLFNDITGLGKRVSTMEILGGIRGPEKARSMNIPFEEKVKWLHTDAEYILRRYTRQMASDVEIYRSTGSVNGATIFSEITEEFNGLRRQIDAKGLTPEKAAAAHKKLSKQQEGVVSDMTVLVERMRHQRGVPEDSNSAGFRLGRMAMDVNVARFMGSVAPSSVADIARPAMKAGLLNTMRHAWLPLISDLSRVKMSRATARELGISWDPLLHNRAQAVFDMMDDNAGRHTLAERSTGFLANKTGLVALFDRWTAENKFLAASVGAAEFSKALRVVAEGGSAKAVKRANELLNSHGIDDNLARKIWDQFNSPNGSTEFDGGVKLPNMKDWTDYESMSAYRAAMNKFADDTIVTPSLDRPSWMDANTPAKMLSQFRSFTFTSNNRIVMAGLQQRDMALVSGVTSSLAMGAVSYYIWAVSVGGDALDKAMKLDPDDWADQAIARSGLMGVFAEAQRVAERVPGLEKYATFTGTPVKNRRSSSLMGAVAGPSFDLGEKMSSVLMGLNDPTQSTLHQARLMAPYQNVFYFRQLMDQIEDGVGDALNLPERRGSK